MSNYQFDIIALTGKQGLTGMEDNPSINDAGLVAFIGQFNNDPNSERIAVGSGYTFTTLSGLSSFSRGVQINNLNQVVGQFTLPSAGAGPVSVVSVWDADTPYNPPVRIVSGGQDGQVFNSDTGQIEPTGPIYPFDLVAATPTINNSGAQDNGSLVKDIGVVVFPALDGTTGLLATRKESGDPIAQNSFYTIQNRIPSRPMVADNGNTVARNGTTGSQSINLYSKNFASSSLIIGPAQAQSLGLSPGISDNGEVVTFYADLRADASTALNLTPGAGIFASINTPTGRFIQQVAGISSGNGYLDPWETFTDLNSNNTFDPNLGEVDSGPFTGFVPNSRVGVSYNLLYGKGQGTVAYLAYDREGREGLYTSSFSTSVGNERLFTVQPPRLVAKVGDTIDGPGSATIQDLEIHDPINSAGQVAFWVSLSDGKNAIVRAQPPAPKVVNIATHGFGNGFPLFPNFLDGWFTLGNKLEGFAFGTPLAGQVKSYVSSWDSSTGWSSGWSSAAVATLFQAQNRTDLYDLAIRTVVLNLKRAGRLAENAARTIATDVIVSGLLGDPQLSINGDQIIHLVGHSRGAAVNARVAVLLAEQKYNINQFTSLDGYSTDWPGLAGLLGDISIVTEVNAVKNIGKLERAVNYRVQDNLFSLPIIFDLIKTDLQSEFNPQNQQTIREAFLDVKAPPRAGFENIVLEAPIGSPVSNHLNITDYYTYSDIRSNPDYILDNYVGAQRNIANRSMARALSFDSSSSPSAESASVLAESTLSTNNSNFGNFSDGSFEELGNLQQQIASITFPIIDDPAIQNWITRIQDTSQLVSYIWDVNGDVQLIRDGNNTLIELRQTDNTSLGQLLNLNSSPISLGFDLSVASAGVGDRLQVLFQGNVLQEYVLADLSASNNYSVSLVGLGSQSGDLTFQLTGPTDNPSVIRLDNLTVLESSSLAPVASDDGVTINEDTPIAINVLTNDSDADGSVNPATILITRQASRGLAVVNPNNGQITFTPNAGFSGTTSFSYTVRDNDDTVSDIATVTVTVNSVNDIPVTNPDSVISNGVSPSVITVLGNDSDPEGDALSIDSVTQGKGGTVTINSNGTLTYTPNANFDAQDTFTYIAKDANGGKSSPTTVTITDATRIIVVNSTGDLGDADPTDDTADSDLITPGLQVTLRSAIDFANARAGKDIINFNIPTGDAGYNATNGSFRIQPNSTLPTITDSIILDATTQPGFTGRPVIELNGIKTVNGTSNVDGLTITAGNSIVRGFIINQFTKGNGISLRGGGNNRIEGNFIGTDATGTSVGDTSNNSGDLNGDSPLFDTSRFLGNGLTGGSVGVAADGLSGIYVDAASSNNIIGGTTPGSRNVISGNGTGVLLEGNGNTLQGNLIGTDVTGTVALGNVLSFIGDFFIEDYAGVGIGVAIRGNHNIIGGTTDAGRNVISGNTNTTGYINTGYGISLETREAGGLYGASENTIQGNYIGTDITGVNRLGNTGVGITIQGRDGNNLIGGSIPGAANVISGNGQYGILSTNNSSGNRIQGNFVGTAEDGTTPLGNGYGGISLAGFGANFIGGSSAEGNIVAFNGRNNLQFSAGISIDNNNESIVSFNRIFSNIGNGIKSFDSSTAIHSNTIYSNTLNGILLEGFNNPRSSLISNTTYGNGLLGIDLGGNGVTSNDAGDGDTGPNNLQNFPTIISVTSGSSTTNIEGILTSNRANSRYYVEFFSNSSADSSGYGEGETLLGSTFVTSDNNGLANFVATFPVVSDAGRFITATATATDIFERYTDTSEFSNVVSVTRAAGPEIRINDVSQLEGNSGTSNFTFTITLSQASNQIVTVDALTFNGSATLVDGDYQTLPTTRVTFNPGETSKTVTVRVNGDTIPEGDETFFVRLRNATNATITDSQGVGTIQTDEPLATTIVVNSTADDPDADPTDGVPDADLGTPGLQTTLRAAIEFANSTPGVNTIHFNIAGTASPIIRLSTALPEIYEAIVIDGTTQPSFSGTPIVTLDGSNAGLANGLTISAGNSTIRGLFFWKLQGEPGGGAIVLKENGSNRIEGNVFEENGGGVGGSAIEILNSFDNMIGGTMSAQRNVFFNNSANHIRIRGSKSQRNSIQGNFIGIDNTERFSLISSAGVLIDDDASNNTIGGTAPGARNVIAGSLSGVELKGGGRNIVQGNYIGTDISGTRKPTNMNTGGTGISITSRDNVIGGTQPGAGNIISGNGTGVYIRSDSNSATGNVLQGNLIGTAADGISPLGNSNWAIFVQHGAGAPNNLNTLIGGTESGAGNIIAFNGDPINVGNPTYGQYPAVLLSASGNSLISNSIFSNYGHGVQVSYGERNRIQSNQIYSNSLLGIDLTLSAGESGIGGVTPNDVGDGDTGGNLVQNFPVITGVTASGSVTTLRGRLNSASNKPFKIEFFSNPERDPSGYGEGKTLLGSTTVQTDLSGNVTFNITFPVLVSNGQYITATATDSVGNTSEFSQGFLVSNSPVPSLAINDPSIAEGNSGTRNLNFTVALSAVSNQIITVQYATVAESAIANGDYTPRAGILTFNPGETTKTVSVPILGDTDYESDETFRVVLSNPSNATLIKEIGIGKIINDDVPVLTIANAFATEGNYFEFTVTLSRASTETVTVNYADTPGTATSDDYVSNFGQVTFAPGETTKTIGFYTYDDTEDESAETFTVTLTSPTNAVIGTATATGTIIDNDAPPDFVPTLSITDQSVSEGAGTATFIVTLSKAINRAVTVNYTTENGTATAGTDYITRSGQLTFAAGESSKTIVVPILDDTLYELSETFNVSLSSPTEATLGKGTAVGTITDNDVAPVLPSLSINNVSIAEGNQGTTTATFTVSLSAISSQAVTVNYATANGTAVAGTDFTSTTGTLTFAAGEVSKTISVAIAGDTSFEANETFQVNLLSPTNATLATAQGLGTILNDDEPAMGVPPSPISYAGGRLGIRRSGTSAANRIAGTINNDTLNGLGGNDELLGSGGNDQLFGGTGADRLYGGAGNDRLDGGIGNDQLNGDAGRDQLVGGAGVDVLVGGIGDDSLIGGVGADRITGGAGRDVFAFRSTTEGADTITDFGVAADFIDLRTIFARTQFSGVTPYRRFAQFVRVVQVGTSTQVRIDNDGNGAGTVFSTLATLTNIRANAITPRNFLV
ncbi:Ig-like domain-containing protein [Leptolyngbya sp. PL-A3]|uniref:Calx-beta domain-containing protein n=1 Tax=Leptolyngbya sp. PL-A3 TaxID=2933911 RepID=UPI00329A78AD